MIQYDDMRVSAFVYIAELIVQFDNKPIRKRAIERNAVYEHCLYKRYFVQIGCGMHGPEIMIEPDVYHYVKTTLQSIQIIKES